jgi:P4 family phage/plasmid primase-like protien
MTEKIDIKKLNKLKEGVQRFLDEHRFTDDSKEQPTHLSFGLFQGKFVLDKQQRKEFMNRYIKAVDGGVTDMSILERPKEYGPVIIDIDLEVPSEDYEGDTRLYNNEMISGIIKLYVDAINKYLDVNKKNVKVCLFEKPSAQEKDSTYRDGFHIMFPELCLDTKVRHLLRYHVVKQAEQNKLFDGFTKSADKIIDKSVVSTNAWFLYGSRKPTGQLYKLNTIYDMDMNVLYNNMNAIDLESGENISYDIETLVQYFSLQSSTYTKKNVTKLREEYVDSDIDAECEKLGINSTVKAEQIKIDIVASKEDEIRRATKFVCMLSDSRSTDYQDWINVGLALHSVDSSLVSAWVEFSKKGGSKYKDGECERIWRSMKSLSTGNMLTLRSLAYWAKQDDPKQFEAFKKEEFKILMKNSLNGNIYSLAKNVYAKYSDRYVCSSIKSNIWWEFRNHRWNRVEEAYTMKILLSEEFANEYNKEIAEVSIRATQVQGFEKEELLQRRTKIDKIVENLMNTRFKETLVKECASLFYDKDFEQKLDSNIHLIGCENGVYDLQAGSFREGRPDDYITLSTKNEYHKWNEKNPYNKQILSFFSQVLPNENVRKYFLNALCTCLSGTTKEEKLYIMTGAGSNGKSLTMDLSYFALGDYYMSCPISMMTNKRGKSNETSPEKVRMKGRRCGVFQETDDGEKLNVGIMKEFTGGDKVLVRDLFKGSQEMIEFKPQMKYFLTCNQLPEVPSTDDGTWRRLRVIAFTSKFTSNPTKSNEFLIDNTLKQKIEAWAPTFFSYLIHIYNTEYKNKTYLVEPEEVMASTKQYKQENDHFTEYIMDKISVTENIKDVINKDTLWDDFRIWYKNGRDQKTLPKRVDFLKAVAPMIGEPTKAGFFRYLVFNFNEEDKEVKNDLDV